MSDCSESGKWRNVLCHILSTGATMVVGAMVIILLKPPKLQPQTPRDADNEQPPPVSVVAHGVIAVTPDTPLAKKLTTAAVSTESLSTPLLSTTGEVVACLAVGAGTTGGNSAGATPAPSESGGPAWTFGSPDLFSTYTSWLQSRHDVKFASDEVEKIRALDQAKVDDLQKTADRLRELVKIGSDAPKDLQQAESDLLQARLQMEKDIYEAQKSLKDAQRTGESLTRQLVDADAPPDLLRAGQEGTVIVAASVPEARLALIREGACCNATFYGLPGMTFSGKVGRLGAVLARDRRTLRVLFVIDDPRNHLRSNMFADVGLCTDTRKALTVPVEALLHEGEADYVLVCSGKNSYRATAVDIGEEVGQAKVEILKGVSAGDQILSSGAILLKPYVVEALEEVK